MKFVLTLPVILFPLLPAHSSYLDSQNKIAVCKSFSDGNLDAYTTLEVLDLDLKDYSIGVNNTVRIFCS